ncbi:MAG: nucleotidyl transferase AbiEii/AbiGii toxin family protein [Bacillota bacterium]|nr:nucleotidyl transferase AbiEii/AbiGii toxin family protein [Bacillota bacterium]
MNRIAKLSSRDREELFLATAHDIKLPEAMAEKDFWVCWVLDYLFHQSPWAKHMAFKGGTSLSKCYGLIERFSEDIDIILDWRVLGFLASEPWDGRSKTSQDKFNKDRDARTGNFLHNVLLPQLKEDFAQLLSEPFKLFMNDDEPQTICFAYPRIFDDTAVVSVVRMEIGALAAWTPVQKTTITSYAAKRYPQAFTTPSTSVLTVMAERTFWEKVTILHKEAFRTNSRFPSRYSRHYYDLYCMDKSPVKAQAYDNLPLLERVVKFKARFYPTNVARYDLAHPGTMRLMPPEDCIPVLVNDYEHMKNMIFGTTPSFEKIMDTLQCMETEINALG